MGAGAPEVAAPPWRRALLTWMLIMSAETVHGMARNVFLAPAVGDLRARQLGVIIASVIVLLIAWLSARWIGAATRRDQLLVGAFWVLLTVCFEVVLGRAIGASWDRIVSDYNPARGGYMIAGLAVMFVAPVLTSVRRVSRGGAP